MLYSLKNARATVALPRIVLDADSFKTLLAGSKAARAVAVADIVDGYIAWPKYPTAKLLAVVFGVSSTSVNRAYKLNRQEPEAVSRGQRPLFPVPSRKLPSVIAPQTPPSLPVVLARSNRTGDRRRRGAQLACRGGENCSLNSQGEVSLVRKCTGGVFSIRWRTQ